jgi:competence protein ComEA
LDVAARLGLVVSLCATQDPDLNLGSNPEPVDYHRLMMRIAVFIMLLVPAAIAASVGPPAQSAPSESPEDVAGRKTLEQVCVTCHDAKKATEGFRTATEWDMVLEEMVTFGATATDEQFEQVKQYLLRNHGKVEVNRARAPEFMPVLGVTASVAEAIVQRRAAQGPFKTIDDLKQVPGLDAAKVDAREERLVF